MYDMDWGIDPKPKKKRGRPRKNDSRQNGCEGGKKGGFGTRKMSIESRAKSAESNRNNSWRRHSPNKGSATMQSSSGFAGESDYSVHDSGRVYPSRILLDEGWKNG